MKFLWCDIETTGLDPENAAPFQVAFIFVSTQKINGETVKDESSRVFYLNPLDIPGIEYNEEAGKIHGYTEEQIRSFEPAKDVVPKIKVYLEDCIHFRFEEKPYFVGYNSNKFDWDHLVSIFSKFGFTFNDYFAGKLDVFDQVKRAGALRVLPYLENRKLTTVAKFLGIDLENAHDALGDITATREVAKSLALKGVPLQ